MHPEIETLSYNLFSAYNLLIINFLLQSLAKHNRSNIGTEGGPPPFVPFGQVQYAALHYFIKTPCIMISRGPGYS